MGASFSLTGGQILAAMEEYLQHLLDCEQFILDLHDHPQKPLHATYSGRDGKKLDQWDQDRINAAIRFVTKYAADATQAEGKKMRPVEALLSELPRLREAEDVVKGIGFILRYQLPEPTREERIKMYEAGQRTLRDRLDTLTKFDDSE
jgi:hypothetical protein